MKNSAGRGECYPPRPKEDRDHDQDFHLLILSDAKWP